MGTVWRSVEITNLMTHLITVEVEEDATDEDIDRAGMAAWADGDTGTNIDNWTQDLKVLPYSEDDQP